ncbi:MAG TPA: HlyD family secretion protein [Candidatus Acidoferrales bacterium]|nr:HlyD family secretion protein [Candidatus Acidoferrales bacterium]
MASRIRETEIDLRDDPRSRTVTAEPEKEAPAETNEGAAKAEQRGHVELPDREEKRSPVWQRQGARRWIFGGALVLAALSVLLFLHYHWRESTDDAQVDGHLDQVSSKVSGNVVSVLVDDNQAVRAGQVLVKIDSRDYQARVDQMKAALALAQAQEAGANVNVPLTSETTQSGESSASANLSSTRADQTRAQAAYQKASTADLSYARAELDKQQANYTKAHSDLERMRPLVEKAEISQQQFDAFVAADKAAKGDVDAATQQLAQAEQNAAMAKAQLESADAKVSQAQAGVRQAQANQKQVSVRQADAKAASATVQKAQADLDAALLQLSYTTVVAPVDGVVTNKTVQVGQVLQPGESLMVVVPLNEIWVTANFKETQLAKVRQGQRAEVHVDMYGQSFSGHVDSIAGATGSKLSLLPPENATGNFVKVVQRIPVKIVLDPIPADKAILRPGMNVDATIFTR